MTDTEAKTLPGADPAHVAHPLWAALQLARMLREDDGFDRNMIAVSLLTAAQIVAAEQGDALGFAIHMEREACRTAAEVGIAMAVASNMARN